MKRLLVFLLLANLTTALAQNDVLLRRYTYGKSLYQAKNYQAAFDALVSVVEKSPNAYEPYARFLAGMSAYRMGQKQEAARFFQSAAGFSSTKDHALLMLGVIAFEKGEFFDAFSHFQRIQNAKIAAIARRAARRFLVEQPAQVVADLALAMPDKVPGDIALSKVLQLSPSQRPTELMERYQSQFASAIIKGGNGRHRDSVRIVVLLPFGLEKINTANPFQENNQRYLDFYEGIRQGALFLDSVGIPVALYVFDTERDSSRLVSFFMQPPMREMDLFIGPATPKLFVLAQEFARQYEIPIVFPLWSVGQTDFGHPYTYSLSSSDKTQAQVAAWFAFSELESKAAYIYYGETKSDSLMALAHAQEFERLGGQVMQRFKLTKEKGLYQRLLAELRNIAPTSGSHIFAPVRDEVEAMTLTSALTSLSLNRPLFVPAGWLNFKQIHYEQLERMNAHILVPPYFPKGDSLVDSFVSAFTRRVNMIPFESSFLGFETIIFFAKNLYQNPGKLSETLRRLDPERGQVLQGIDLRRSNDNRFVPILRFRSGVLEIANSFEP